MHYNTTTIYIGIDICPKAAAHNSRAVHTAHDTSDTYL